MDSKKPMSVHARRGIAYVTVLVVLLIFTTLSLAYMSATTIGLKKSSNLAHVHDARMAAESGMSFILTVLQDLELPSDTAKAQLIANLHTALGAKLDGTDNLAGAAIAATHSAITVPEIQLPDGTFACTLTLSQGRRIGCTLTVTGTAWELSRRVAMDVLLAPKRSWIFDYGVVSRGKIVVSGSGVVTGGTNPLEAKIMSTRDSAPAIEIGGSATIGGNLNVIGQSQDFVSLGGSGIMVGGETDKSLIRSKHVNVAVDTPPFPAVITDPFDSLAVNEINSQAQVSGASQEFTNIRIAAGTDPHFESDAVINGVMYVEAPNVVTLSGGVTVNGIIVTEEDTSQNIQDCRINFEGHVAVPGVDALPDDDPDFAALKQYRGTAILAPGFSLVFTGGSGTVNGVIAADDLDFVGNPIIAGDLYGTVIGLKDMEILIEGSSEITINRTDHGVMPAGFDHPLGLHAVGGSYREPIGN